MRVRRWLVAVWAVGVLPLTACGEAERLAKIAPRLLQPGQGVRVAGVQAATPETPAVELPPRQPTTGYTFEEAGTDAQGRQLFRVRIGAGGSPFMVASEKLTPLFSVDGKNGAEYVAEAFFRSNPNRTPSTIQPDDEFVLALPADAFVVRWQEERREDLGQPAFVHELVSERGDRLRYYLTDPFPIRYETEPAGQPSKSTVHLHPDLEFLLRTGQTDALRLARLVYRVQDPDIFQVESMRRVAAEARLGVEKTLEVDRTRSYLDPAREAMARAKTVEAVAEPERAHLRRAVFAPDDGVPFAAVEDALGTRTDLSELESGQVFRVEYLWDGEVRVYYKTGADDALGKRDPYLLRENERWEALYKRLLAGGDGPAKWGAGEPSDMAPFASARDPNQRGPAGERGYDFLLPGRAMVLTFKPVRYQADVRASAELRALLGEARERYREPIDMVLQALGSHQTNGTSPEEAREFAGS